MYENTIYKVKTAMRISHSRLDEEIEDEIKACLFDLKATADFKDPCPEDPLILNLIKLWCRATYEEDPSLKTEFWNRYDQFKGSLSMTAGYGGESDE